MRKTPTTHGPICPVCRNTKLRAISSLDGHQWSRCIQCSTLILISKAKTEAYPQAYYGNSSAKFSGWVQHLRTRFHRERSRLVCQELSQKKGTVYDVGCGDGLFLNEASRLGLQINGFEPESTPRSQAEKRLGKQLDRKLFDSLGKKKAAAITCWQVIEHLPDPPSFLRACHKHLAEEGLLALSTVNLDSVQAKCFGGKWLHLDPPRHLWVGTMDRVIQLVKDSGFQVVRVRYNCLEFGPVGWIDSIFNLMETKRDRLLGCLKHGCHEPRDWLVWLLSVALTPIAFILAWLEGGLGRPATFEIYARLVKKGARRQGG
jgi:SAM-dependent methyltransferase